MADLVDILIEHEIGSAGNDSHSRMKEIVADAIGEYLQDHAIVTSLEVRAAVRKLAEDRVMRNPNRISDDYVDYGFCHNYHLPGENTNPHIWSSQAFQHKPMGEVLDEAKKTLRRENEELEIDVILDLSGGGRRVNPRGIYVYFTDEEKVVPAFIDKLTETHRSYRL